MKKSIAPDRCIFQESYRSSRLAFKKQAVLSGGEIDFVRHPRALADDHAAYGIDIAWFGPRDAAKVLVMISGTHGPELLAGSAMQFMWMAEFSAVRNPDTAIFLIHGANPYGCASIRRTTENNVDLNRNFIDFANVPQRSVLSKKVQDVLCARGLRGPQSRRTLLYLLYLGWRHGLSKISNEITAGQYFRPDGVGFGGAAPEWAHGRLRAVWESNLAHARRVAIVDWHTGIGGYGTPSFLCFDDPASPEFARAAAWWGAAVNQSNAHFEVGARPSYQGLLVRAVQDIALQSGAETTAAVIEFGTYPNKTMLKGLLIDRWLQNAPADACHATKTKLERELMGLFYPTDPKWRRSVAYEGRGIITQTLAGLQHWENAV